MIQTLFLLFLLVYALPLSGGPTPGLYLYLSPFIVLQGYGRSWIEYALISITMNYYLNFSFLDVTLSVCIYGFVERFLKETWVIGDSNK